VSGIERIAAAFAGAGKRAALMPYLMGGFPDDARSRAIGDAYAAAGADLVELGVPFSDPLADGPVIQAAGTAALRAGATVESVLAHGGEAFVDRLAAAGVSGLIVPDLPFEEAPALAEACDARALALVPLVAPTTPDDRLERIGARARGFLYTVSVTGTTGERAALSETFGAAIARAKAHTDVPVALGFGIAAPEQAVQAMEAGADGVIVGSRLVRAAAEADDPAAAVRALVEGFSAALA
jgi:tryptophan synthase alpha chain